MKVVSQLNVNLSLRSSNEMRLEARYILRLVGQLFAKLTERYGGDSQEAPIEGAERGRCHLRIL